MCSEDGIEEKVKQLNFCNKSALEGLVLKVIFSQLSTDKSLDVEKRRCFDDSAVDNVVSSPMLSTKFS